MLYKYRNCMDGQERSKRVEGMLRDGDMFFAIPSEFEDVHDCEITVELHATNSMIRKYWKEEIIPKDKNFEKTLHDKKWFGDPQKFAAFFNTRLKGKQVDILGIYCLCQNPCNKEMWNKYAWNEGICIGYRTQPFHNSPVAIELKESINYDMLKDHYLTFDEVNYNDTGHPAINRLPMQEFSKRVMKALLTKDEKWSFEEESRGFILKEFIGEDIKSPGKLMHCSDDAIGEVIFSPWSSTETIEWVIRLIAGRPCGINGVKFLRFGGNEISMLHY